MWARRRARCGVVPVGARGLLPAAMAPLSPLRVTMQGILEPSGRDIFDHLTRLEMPPVNTPKSSWAENTLSSVNTGLPSHLIERHDPWPAYTTHTAPVVKMLVEQDELRKATSIHAVGEELVEASPEADWEEQTQVLSQPSGSSCSEELAEDSEGKAKSKTESSLPSQTICNRVIFARKTLLRVLPHSSFLSSSKKKSSDRS